MRTVFGLDAVRSGQIRVGQFTGFATPGQRWRQRVGLLSENRKEEGLATSLSIAQNLILSNTVPCEKSGFLLPSLIKKTSQKWVEALSVRCHDPLQRIGDLSGGNQQKVAFARLLYDDVDVLLLDEPTRGIDVGSKSQIYKLIDQLASEKKAVIMISSYLPELLGVCDRIAVMCRGRLGVARPVSEVTEHTLMLEGYCHQYRRGEMKVRDSMLLLTKLGPALGLVLVYGLFIAIGPPSFATFRNVEAIVRQTTIVGISALGMTLVIIAGGIDLSIGSIVALVTVVIATLLTMGISPILACIGGMGSRHYMRCLEWSSDYQTEGSAFYRHLRNTAIVSRCRQGHSP